MSTDFKIISRIMMNLRKISFKTPPLFLCTSMHLISTSHIQSSFEKNEKPNKIGFVGAGNMARAIMKGFISKKNYKAEEIYVTDHDREFVEYLKNYNPLFKVNFFI